MAFKRTSTHNKYLTQQSTLSTINRRFMAHFKPSAFYNTYQFVQFKLLYPRDLLIKREPSTNFEFLAIERLKQHARSVN